MKKILLLTIILSALFAGCEKTTKIKVTTNEFRENIEYLETSIDYPIIEQFPALTEKITDYINFNYATYKDSSKGFWEEISLYDESPFFAQFNYDVTYEVTESTKFWSLTTCEYVFLGGAHGSTVFKTFTIDKKTGEEVSLEKLTGLNYQQIAESCREQLIDTLITNNPYDEEDSQWLKEYIEMGTNPDEPESFSVYAVSGDKVIITFNQYQVAPYVYGIQAAELPLLK